MVIKVLGGKRFVLLYRKIHLKSKYQLYRGSSGDDAVAGVVYE